MAQKIFQTNKLSKFSLFLLLILIDIIFCDGCQGKKDLTDTSCFNDVITFDHNKWRAGNACTNSKGEVIVEFSLDRGESSTRLFYGLKKNGRYYFEGEPVFKEIDYTQCADCDNGSKYKGRFESRNLLVSLESDSTKSKQYLFSMSTYYSLVELVDFENNLNYKVWNVTKFFGLPLPIFSYEYSLFEIEETRTYIAAFIDSAGYNHENKELANTTYIIKFSIQSFDSSTKKIYSTSKLIDTYNGRAVSAFRLDISKLIVVLFMKKDSSLYTQFYDDNMNDKGIHGFWGIANSWEGYGIFSKVVGLKNDYAFFAFFGDGNNRKSLIIHLEQFEESNNEKKFAYRKHHDFNYIDFRPDVQSNGLVKLNDDRLVLFTTEDYNNVGYGSLHMFLIDFYNNYAIMKLRDYQF